MALQTPVSPPERNQKTYARHRREVLWQITVPLVIGIVVIVLLGLLSAFGVQASVQSQLADAALINLITQAMIMGLLTLILLIGTVYLLARILKVLPFQFYRLQKFFVLVHLRVSSITDALVNPILRARSFSASAGAFRRSVKRAIRF
jgi:hypothetical protein